MDNKVNNGVAETVVEAPKDLNVNTIYKKSSKELRKIDDKSVEQVLKALNSLQTPEEKLAAMCKKYTEIVDENKKFIGSSKQWEKKYLFIQREKEQLQMEYNKTILLKVKLESLCRELQKQNKAVKDESLLKIREEEERRKETQAKFQNTLTEITTLMQQNNEKNSKLRDDNLDMTKKFKSVVEQYELREQQVDKMAKQMTLEAQLAEAKLNKANLEAQAEREKMLAEKKQLLLELSQYQTRCTEMQATEVALRCQVSMYTDKYDEFQNALTKSNEVFGGFKGEMEKMSKKILKLEKETTVWKQRWEKSHAALLDMAAEKQQRDASVALQARQLLQLQRLCRTMQAERASLLTTLKENNIERPPLPQLPPEPEVVPESLDRVDAMAANCAQLKHSLAQLQGQLDVLTSKSGYSDESQLKPAEKSCSSEPPTSAPQKNKMRKGKGKKGKQNEVVKETTKENDGTIESQEPKTENVDCQINVPAEKQIDCKSNESSSDHVEVSRLIESIGVSVEGTTITEANQEVPIVSCNKTDILGNSVQDVSVAQTNENNSTKELVKSLDSKCVLDTGSEKNVPGRSEVPKDDKRSPKKTSEANSTLNSDNASISPVTANIETALESLSSGVNAEILKIISNATEEDSKDCKAVVSESAETPKDLEKHGSHLPAP